MSRARAGVATWTGREATALRQAHRLTVERFAAHLAVTPRAVANWAAQPDMVPRPAVQQMLDQMLEEASAGALLRFEELIGYRCTRPTLQEIEILGQAMAELTQRLDDLRLSLVEATQAKVRVREAVPT